MKTPMLTAIYAAVLMLLYVALSVQVIRLRQGRRVGRGDGGDPDLGCAIRIHAHFAEYTPFALLLIGYLEVTGLGRLWLHILLGALLVARFIHPLGMMAQPGTAQFTFGRIGGMALTLFVMTASAVLVLARLLFGAA